QSREAIYSVITDVYRNFEWLLDENILNEGEITKFNQILLSKASSTIYETAIKHLAQYLHRHSGEKALVLLDEYDAAIHAGFYYGFYDEIIALMKSILGNTFKDNIYLYKGVLTGILRVAKESIFSDMNNPGIFTVLSNDFSDKFGFTEDEVKDLTNFFEIAEDFKLIKQWYNGYRIGEVANIYNPWSIVNYIARRSEGFKSYWGNTSSDDIIRSSITAKENNELRTSVEKLIKGETVDRVLNENITFSEFYENQDIFWSLLTFSGYLTPTASLGFDTYSLRIPNYEIQTLFRKMVLNWFSKDLKIYQSTLLEMTRALTEKRFAEFEETFQKVMGDTFSYFDTHTEPERVFQAYLLGLLGILSDDYIIKSNRESGKGRYDILLLPKDKTRYGIIMELKQLKNEATENQRDTALNRALAQIQNNKYYKELEVQEITERLEMAIVFVGKEAHLKYQFS
ncbi:MAG: AAA family ATPase, partial [Bacteroidota bacterium]